MSMKTIENFITQNTPFPLKDRHDMPSSKHVFEGGAHGSLTVA